MSWVIVSKWYILHDSVDMLYWQNVFYKMFITVNCLYAKGDVACSLELNLLMIVSWGSRQLLRQNESSSGRS